MKKSTFYNRYHRQNSVFHKIIGEKNFTYYPLLKTIKQIPLGKESEVLDVGCGVGSLDFFLYDKVRSVVGIDVSQDAIKICNQFLLESGIDNVSFLCGDIEKITMKRKFDLILCTEVIEHLENDSRFLYRLSKLLRKSGYLLLSTPSKNAPLYRLGLLKDFDTRVGHVRRYSELSIKEILLRADFEIISIYKNESILRNSLFTFSMLGNLIKVIRKPFVPLFHRIDDFLCLLFGESDLIVVARKK